MKRCICTKKEPGELEENKIALTLGFVILLFIGLVIMALNLLAFVGVFVLALNLIGFKIHSLTKRGHSKKCALRATMIKLAGIGTFVTP